MTRTLALLPALLWSEEHGAGSRNYTGHCGLKEMFDKDSRGHPEADSKIGGDYGDMGTTRF